MSTKNAGDTQLFTSLRKCETYNPANNMIPVEYTDSGRTELYLEVKYRLLWFQEYCAEKNISGFVDDSDVVFLPEARMFKATASVFMDDKLVGKSAAGVFFSSEDQASARAAIQTAATYAKGRALANAGFGTVNCQPTEEGDRFPCDAGMTITDGKIVSNPQNPMDASFEQPKNGGDKSPPKRAGSKSNSQPEQNRSESPYSGSEMTLQQAKSYVVPIGNDKGKTLGELLALNPNMVAFYAGDNFKNERYIDLKNAAQIVWQAQQKAS